MTSLNYSDILVDILDRKHSKCICPAEYLAGLRAQAPNRPAKAECQFGPGCNFVNSCHFAPSKCTCRPQCTCDLEVRRKQPVDQESGVSKPRPVTLTCTCADCTCGPQQSKPELLPSCLQDVIKSRVHSKVCDHLMKKQCEEIKQIIQKHKDDEDTAKVKPEFNAEKTYSDKEVKLAPDLMQSIMKNSNETTKPSETESEVKSLSKNRKASIQGTTEFSEKSLKVENRRSILKSGPDVKSAVQKKETKGHRSKVPKKLYSVRTKSMAVRTNYYCGCKDYSKRRPPRIRYYYGGGTENYGSKVGHRNCVVPPVSVPKHMGWLWNIEDPSKGIRERKGWPPGFIAKNIKHMMRVMKSMEAEGEAIKREEGVVSTWKSIEWTEEPAEEVEEPALLHIHKKGRTYNITFCPKESDDDISPVPIPFSITEKKQEGDSSTTDSSLEFELHSPKPKGKYPKMVRKKVTSTPKAISQSPSTVEPAASSTKQNKRKKAPLKRNRSQVSEENKTNWEEQTTQMQNIT